MLTTHPTYLIPTFEAVSSVLFVAGIGVLVTIRLGRYLRPPSHSHSHTPTSTGASSCCEHGILCSGASPRGPSTPRKEVHFAALAGPGSISGATMEHRKELRDLRAELMRIVERIDTALEA